MGAKSVTERPRILCQSTSQEVKTAGRFKGVGFLHPRSQKLLQDLKRHHIGKSLVSISAHDPENNNGSGPSMGT